MNNTLFNTKETALNTLNEGVTLSAKAIIGAKHIFCSCEGYHMYDVQLTDTNAFNTVEVVRQGENSFLRNASITEMSVMTSNGTFKPYKNFTTDFIIVSMSSERAYELIGQTIFVNHSTGYVSGGVGVTYNNPSKNTHREYAMLMYTSSSVKKAKSIWYDVSTVASNVELMNYIISDVAKDLGDMSLNESLRFASRPGLAWTPNVLFSDLEMVATFKGNFDLMNNTLDGQVPVRASYVAREFKCTEEEACKLTLQARISGVMKFQAKVYPDDLYLEVLDTLKARGCINYLGEGKHSNMILDSNAIKCHITPKKVILSMMSIGKITTSQTSKQLLEKVVIEAHRQDRLNEVVEYLKEQGVKQVARLIANILTQDIKNVNLNDTYVLDVLTKTNPSNPIVNAKRIEDAYQTIKNITDKLNIELVDEDNNATMFNTVVSGDITSHFGKGLIPEDCVVIGKFSKLMDKDPSAREKYGKFIGIKYPSMYINEYASGKVISIEDMVKIVHSSNLSQRAKRGLTMYFRNMPDATIMFPSSRDIFDTCAGMDTDFDKICVIFDKMIVDVLFDRQQVLKISSKAPELAELKYVSKTLHNEVKALNQAIETNVAFNVNDEDFYGKMFCKQIDTDDSIGSITKANNRTIALLDRCKQGDFKPAENFLKENVGFTKGAMRKYEVTRTTVDIAFVDEMIVKMQTVIWNRANIIAFLEDCSKVFRLYQETQIDGAKTGIYLDRRLTARSIQPTSCMNIKIEKVNGVPVIVRETPELKMVKTEHHWLDPIVFTDTLGAIQDALMDVANIEFREVMSINKHLFKYTKEQVEEFTTLYTKLANSKQGSKVLSSMLTLKSAYTSLTSKYIEELEACEDEATKEVIKETYTNNCKVIGNSIRITLNNLKTKLGNLKGAVALAIGCLSSDKINAHSENRFAYNCVPELVYAYLIGESYKAYGTILQTGLELEGTIELVDGVSANGLVIKERYTGTVEFVDGTVFATKKIEIVEPTSEATLIVPKSEIENVNIGDVVYRLAKNSVHFDGDARKKYTVKSMTNVEISVNTNRNTEYKAFWKREECVVITLS